MSTQSGKGDPVVGISPTLETPSSIGKGLRVIGPGLIMAATGVGAGDMVSSLAAGANFGLTLMWAILIGAIFKYALTEGVGRWYLATSQTPVKGIHSLGRVATGYFGIYLVVFAFVYGAAVTAATGLALNAMVPALSITQWAIIAGVVGFAILMVGRYEVFEKVMEALVLLMFVTVVGAAILTAPNLASLGGGLTFHVPGGSLLYVLGLIGGVGGTITLTSYAYWLRDKGWRGHAWTRFMHLDLIVAYVMTPIFMVSMLIVGAQFLFGTDRSISGEEGLVALAEPFGAQFGEAARWLFLLGFFSATFTSLLGGFNGESYLFADLVRVVRGIPDAEAEEHTSQRNWVFRLFLVWATFPPMVLHLLGQPVLLVIVYSAFGALFMPFLAFILLTLLNSKRVQREYRNGILANVVLGLSFALFLGLAVNELIGLF